MRVMVHELKSPAAGAKMLLSALKHKRGEDNGSSSVLDKIERRMDSPYMSRVQTDVWLTKRLKEAHAIAPPLVLEIGSGSQGIL